MGVAPIVFSKYIFSIVEDEMFLRLETAKINLQCCDREKKREGEVRAVIPGISGVGPGQVGGDLVLQHVEALVLQGLHLRLLPQSSHV